MNRKSQVFLFSTMLGFPALANAFQAAPPSMLEIIDLGPWTRTWPTDAFDNPLPSTNIGRAVSGDFSGDRTPDVWQHTSTHLILFLDPSYMDCTVELSKVTSSIARLPGTTPGSKDRLLIADAGGLSTVEYTMDSGTGDWSISVNLLTSEDYPNGYPSVWNNAKSLSCPDLTNDGHSDILAISGDGTKVIRLINNGSGDYTPAQNINVGSGAFETFALMYQVGTGVLPQVAILSPSWFSIAKFDGVRSKVIQTNTPFGHIAKITQAPVGGQPQVDCVAWLQESPPDPYGDRDLQVRLIDSTGEQEQDPVPMDEVEISAIFAGDTNNDGNAELGLLTKNSQVVYLYQNLRDAQNPTGDRFSNGNCYGFSVAISIELGDDNTSTPLLADLNFDRKADLFTVNRNYPATALSILTDPPEQYGPPAAQGGTESTHPCFHIADFYSLSYFTDVNCDPGPETEGVLVLEIKDAWELGPDPVDWIIELVMYKQPEGDTDVLPNAVRRYEYDLDGGAYAAPPTSAARWALPIAIPTVQSRFTEKYFIIVRAVPTQDQVPLTEFVIAFTCETSDDFGNFVDPPLGPVLYIQENLAGSWDESIGFVHHEFASGCGPGPEILAERHETSGAMPVLRVPRYSAPPNPGDPYTPPANPNN